MKPKYLAALLITVISFKGFSQKSMLLDLDVIKLKDSTYIQIEKKNKVRVYNYSSTLILKPSEYAEHRNKVYEGYDKNSSIKTLEIIIKDTLGKQIARIKKSDFEDYPAFSGGTMYSDNRLKLYKFTPTSYPYVMDIISEVVDESTVFLPSFRLTPIPKSLSLKESFTIQNETDIRLRFKKYNFDSIPLVENITPKTLSFTSTMITPQLLMNKTLPPSIEFSLDEFSLAGVEGKFTNWQEFGDWCKNSLLKGTDELPLVVQQEILDLVKNETDTLNKIRKIYQYMQSRTRYISVQIGIGGWKPFPASEVHRLGYGDCKALSNYTRSLLAVAGIKAYYSIIYATEDIRSFDKDFAAMGGNHAILSIPLPKDTIWLECTAQDLGFNQLGYHTRDRYAISIGEKGTFLFKTPIMDEKTNQTSIIGEFSLDNKGMLSGDIQYNFKGLKYLENLESEDKIDETLSKFLKEELDISQMDILDRKYNHDKNHASIQKSFKIENVKFAKKLGNDLFCHALPSSRIKKPYLPSNLNEKIEINGNTLHSKFTFTIPEGFMVKDLPKNIEKQNKFGSYRLTISQEANKIVVDRLSVIYHHQEKLSIASEYTELLDFISKTEQTKLIFTPSK